MSKNSRSREGIFTRIQNGLKTTVTADYYCKAHNSLALPHRTRYATLVLSTEVLKCILQERSIRALETGFT